MAAKSRSGKGASTYKDILKIAIAELGPLSDAADILLIDRGELTLQRDDKNKGVSQTQEKGAKIRVELNGRYKEVYTTDLTESGLIKAARSLRSNLGSKGGDFGSRNPKEPSMIRNFKEKGKTPAAKIPLKKKMDFLGSAVKKLMASKGIVSARTLYLEEGEKRVYFGKGKFLSQELIKTTLILMAFVKSADGDTRFAYRSYVGNGFEITKKLDSRVKEIVAEAKKLVGAKKITPGKYVAILSPDISGLLAHESFGHGMESDTVYAGRAKSSDYVGKRLASPLVSIADSPLIKGKHGSYFFDDDGNFSRETFLIKKGVVGDYLTEGYSAKRLGSRVSANSRCESFDHKNYARMSNTYFLPGDSSFKKMISSVKEGIYLIKANGGGMEDPKGWGVQIQGIVAQRIKNGKLIDEYFDGISITGYLPDILSNIKAASKEFEIEGGGNCGKGHKEWVPVAEGGPYLLIEGIELS